MEIVPFLFIILASQVFSIEDDELCREWKKFQKKYYHSLDEIKNFETFEENLKKIQIHNARYVNGLETYSMGINKFAHLTDEEFMNTLSLRRNNYKIPSNDYEKKLNYSSDYPDNIDWREKGAVTPVKDSENCAGSDFAFTTAGLLEAQYQLSTGKLVNISAQNLIDCVNPAGNNCEGDVYDSLSFLTFQGIELEDDYPYENKKGECRYDRSRALLSTTGPNMVEHDEGIITQEISSGPVAVQINISPMLKMYSSGIFSDENCNDSTVKMFMLAVGYGSEDGKEYYILKNSWGAQWGENGYFRLARNNDNMCSITNYAVNCKITPPVDS